MIKFKNVYVQYVKEFYSLYDFSCVIDNNTLFVGDFFSGTSAIMRTLAKIDKHYSGEILVDNVNLKNIKDKDFSVAYLPENAVLFKNKNIFKNLFYSLKIRKIKKNIAKNLIYSIFLELKNNNFEIFNKYLNNQNIKENLKNEELFNSQIIDVLKLKIKKLNLSEQKIITLIRALLRKPKYVLIENFFENLNEECVAVAQLLIEKLKQTSTIIACEKSQNSNFEDFKINNLTNEKKED